MYYVDKNVYDLDRIFDQNKREGFLRLDLNENPGGLPEDFIKEVLSNVDQEFVSQYPETLEFTEMLAEYLGTDIEHICLVNGSSEGIRQIIEAYSSVDGEIIGVTPAYAMFEVYSKMYGRNYVSIPYDDNLEISVDDIIGKMSTKTELLILQNPNNPMGNVYTKEDIEKLISEARKNETTVLIDEAYHYFYEGTFIDYALKYDHVFVTRTFSKLFSLAGCRLGYVVGNPEEIAIVQKLCTPHNVNAFGMLFAKAIIQKDGMIDELIAIQKEGKAFLIEELKRKGYQVNAEEGNFIFIKPKTDPKELVKKMKNEKQILVKTYPAVGELGECLRVTTGGREHMERLLNALEDLDA